MFTKGGCSLGMQTDLFGHLGTKKKKPNVKLNLEKEKQISTRSEIDIIPLKSKTRFDRKNPKIQFYECKCGISMHWKVAEGRRDGCPKCGKKIPLADIFEKIS